MIFAQGVQGAQRVAERATIIGQSLRDGEYQVQRIIEQGQDGQGWVFLAMHTTLMIPLALKQVPADQPLAENILARLDTLLHSEDSTGPIITPIQQVQENYLPALNGSATNQFAREALLLARLRHTAIPTLYDYFFESGYWYLVMDYIPGHTLTTYLEQYGPISALEALNCAIQICDTLDYLHTQTPAIVLWNLTTESLRVTPEGILMLANFDLAQYAQTQGVEEEVAGAPTTNGHTHLPGDTEMEMLAYMPVKQPGDARHNKDMLADVYSLGIILREMLYGGEARRTQSGDAESSPRGNEARKDQDLQSAQTPRTHHAPHISTYLKSLVRLATRTEPVDRFQSTQAFALALQRAYQIEEQRAFQEHLLQLNNQSEEKKETEQAKGEPAYGKQGIGRVTRGVEGSGSGQHEEKKWEMGKEETPPVTVSRTLELEQRQLRHAAMQRVRQERQQQVQIEFQLASVDEGLEQRSNQSPSQLSPQAIAHAEAPTVAIPAKRHLRGIVKVNFAIALALCIVLISLLIYVRVAQPLENSIDTLMQRPISSTNQGGNLQNNQATPSNSQSTQNHPGGALVDNYWQALPSLPGAEADNAAVYVELQGRAYIYINGGYHGSSSMTYDHNLYRYDIRASHWEMVSNDHFPGMVNNAADVDEQGHIFFTGGYSSDTYTISSQLYMYDPGTSLVKKITPPAQMPLGFGGSIFADRQGHLYMSQGFTHPGDPHTQAGTGWYRYDIGTNQWHQLAALPVGLGYTFTASDNNGGILLIGGATDAGQHDPTNKIYQYDIASDSWTQTINNLPQAISGAAGCQAWPGQLAIIGGYDPTSDAGSKSTWLLDLHTLKWRSMVDLTIDGSVLGAAACDGKGHVFLERGTSNPKVPTSDYWEMVVAPGIKIDNE